MSTSGPPLTDEQALYEHAPCGLLVTGRDGTILRVNATFCRWIGRTPSDLVGQRKIQDLLTMGGRIFHQTHWHPLLQMQGSVAEVKLAVVHHDGHALPMVMNALRRQDHDGVRHELAVFMAEDRHQYEKELLKARQRAEDFLVLEQQSQQALVLAQERLRLALDLANLFVWEVDPATGLARYEDKVALLLGHDMAATVSHDEFASCIHPEDRDAQALAFARALDPDHGIYETLFRLRGADGQERTVRSSGHAFFNEGRLVHFVGILNDVTDLSRQREAAEDRALFAEQMIGIVSHDLRNPLTAIQMSALLLTRLEPTPAQSRVIARVTSSAARANRLIGDLLDFTQARVGRGLHVTAAPVDLHTLVAEAVDELALAFAGRRLEHRRHGAGPCDADADRLTQLLGNLVANAMTYGAADRPVVVTSSVEADHFKVCVHNEGVPIPPALIPLLFEPMTRGETAGSHARSVGLGLFIVRKIVQAHHGRVEVCSSDADGTTFKAIFPRQPQTLPASST